MSRCGMLLAAAAALVACDGRPREPWQPPHDARVHLTVTFEDRVETPDGPSSWRRLEAQLVGPWRADGVAQLEVASLALRRRDVERPEIELVAGETPADLGRLTRGDLAQLGVLSALRGETLTFELDEVAGLTRIGGLDEALDAARPEGAAALDAWLPMRKALDARRWLTRLRAAGMGEPPGALRDQLTERVRRTQLEVPGRGTTEIGLTGRMAEESDGSPVLQLEAHGLQAAEFTGEPEEVPEALGGVFLPGVELRAETMYLLDAPRPLRGNYTAQLPFRSGHVLTEHVSFTLLVTP